MYPTLYYLLQVLVCSAVLMVYYLLVLRNKKFHQYNRFYLLGVALVSWMVPLIKIVWEQERSGVRQVDLLTVVAAIKAYGAEAKDGVIKITTKKKVNL